LPADENLTAVVCETAQGRLRPFFRPVLRNHLGDDRVLLGGVRLLTAEWSMAVVFSEKVLSSS
jgi:hypothetical protein